MAASVEVRSYHGNTGGTGAGPDGTTGGTVVTATEVRHKRAANDTADLANPIPLPATGAAFGWPKHFKLRVTAAPPTRMEALRWYVDAEDPDIDPSLNWTGISIWAGITTTYRQDVSGMTQWEGTPITGVQRGYGNPVTSAGDVDATPFNSTTPMSVYPGVFLGAELGVGLTQPFVVVQMSVNSSALPGPKTPRAALYRWDEI